MQPVATPYDNREVATKSDYVRPRVDVLRDYEVRIRFLSIGCIIEVGCKSIPFHDVKDAIAELSHYVNDPNESIKVWEERFKKA